MRLRLTDITKTYKSGETVTALDRVSLDFSEHEFVAVLGPSGCGKTTLLNVIGGLDRYDSGDLVINGTSTSQYRAGDWDAYRNHSIGFVFQTYNLIPHQTVLANVEIGMTLSGVRKAERRRRAMEALNAVGVGDQAAKKPNQLSGGQMQRVAIARALVNDPDIVLADEPTGALDSHTSVQLMEILREISQTRLVIMVTHNAELAETYASRIVRLRDGQVLSDTSRAGTEPEPRTVPPVLEPSRIGGEKPTRTAMSFLTAASLSLRNLMTKRGRTIITSFAGSIGIIGVALVLALSSGLASYMTTMQTNALSGFPIQITTTGQTFDMGSRNPFSGNNNTPAATEFPNTDTIYSYDATANRRTHTNVLTQSYLDYIAALPAAVPNAVNAISYQRSVAMNVLVDTGDGIQQLATGATSGRDGPVTTNSSTWQEIPDNADFILSLYDMIGVGSRLPKAANEVALVVDQYNRLPASFLAGLGMTSDSYAISDLVGTSPFRVVNNDTWYAPSGDLFVAPNPSNYQQLFGDSSDRTLTIVGVLRIKPDAASTYFSPGLVYTTALTDQVLASANASAVAQAQQGSDRSVLTGAAFTDSSPKSKTMLMLGADTTPTGINIYPVDFAAKDAIKAYLDAFNTGKAEADQVTYTDMAETISSMTSTLLSTVSYVLIGFAAISLIVSTIMIGIITYVSVLERTKEIGILRAVGARKKDISRVFTTEALIIGLVAGVMGVAIAYLLTIPINGVIAKLTGIAAVATLPVVYALCLVIGSMVLTFIAGFFPSRVAAAKDPVEALRTE